MKIVNMEEVKKEFIRYVDQCDLSEEKIELKKYHSLRVMEVSNELAKKENFSEEEVEIATLIGLLHDIARFKQYTEYRTFVDSQSIDHGDSAVEILEKDNYLRKFIETQRYDDIIKLAIKNHNKYAIAEGLTELQNKFCKLIKDADKLDILFLATENLWKGEKEKMENSELNPKVKEEFNDKKLLNYKNHKKIEYANQIIQFLGYVFDLNYKSSFQILNEQKYIDKMIERFKFKDEYTQKQIIDAGEETKQYILNKIQK